MLPQSNRLHNKGDFDFIKKSGKLVNGKFMAVAYVYKNDTSPSRFGIIVSTKISKRAVDRNYIKRVIRNRVHVILSRIVAGYDCLFLVKKSCLDSQKADLSEEIDSILKQIGVLKEIA